MLLQPLQQLPLNVAALRHATERAQCVPTTAAVVLTGRRHVFILWGQKNMVLFISETHIITAGRISDKGQLKKHQWVALL